jgi:hypothetical protein
MAELGEERAFGEFVIARCGEGLGLFRRKKKNG